MPLGDLYSVFGSMHVASDHARAQTFSRFAQAVVSGDHCLAAIEKVSGALHFVAQCTACGTVYLR